MTTQMSKVIQHLRSAWLLPEGADLTDGHLLECFVSRQETAALETLVRRHAPMVWGVCRRILSNHHDAENALQATFLVLVRKAGSVTPKEMVGNWLYGVARQTALKARATVAKLRTRERQVVDMPDPAIKEQDLSRDLQTLLDQELSRLPDKYRVAIVLCDLEGETRKRAARQLGLPEGTLAGRLTRGRALLAQRLARHGLAVTGGTVAALLSQTAASACMPTAVLSSTIKAVTLFAAGKTAAAGLVSAKVATLTEGVLKAMLLNKLKTVLTALFVGLGMVLFGGGLYLHQAEAQHGAADKSPAAGQSDEKKGENPQKQEQEQDKKGFTAWGQEIGGLQAGLGFLPEKKRTYHHGETVTLVVRVRNVGREAVKFSYLQPFIEHAPIVTDGDGKSVPQPGKLYDIGERLPGQVELAPGKEIELHELKRELKPASESGSKRPRPEGRLHALYGTGKVSVQYVQVLGNPSMGYPGWKLDPALSKLATGKLELQIKEEAKAPQKQEQKQEKEGFTAWGKEVGGLQAGLGYHPGQKRAYSHGETVKLVVRVRNVGKEEVKFQYLRQFFIETPPFVTDGEGKPVRLGGLTRLGTHIPVEVNLAPGKEIELYEWEPEFRPASDRDDKKPLFFSTLYGTGKFQIQYERVFGNTSSGSIKLDPTLSNLATGKLELEIKSEPPPAGIDKKHTDLEGIWEGEIVEFEGRRIADEADGAWKVKILVDGDRFTLRGPSWGTALPSGPYVDNEFTLKAKTSVALNEIDLTRIPRPDADGAPRLVLGVYQLKGDVLRVCLGLENVKRPVGFKTDRSRSEALLVLKRAVNAKWTPLGTGDAPPLTGTADLQGKPDASAITGKEASQNKDRQDANVNPIKIRVYIEKVNTDSRSITASCMTLGQVAGVLKPLRFENLQVSGKAKITDRGKDVKLVDLKLDTGFYLFLEAHELGFEVVGIETIGK
jgi:RNA polymerase sigma factor (sigma-70 family)